MTADLYARLAARFSDTVAAVPDDRWYDASPCPDWTARSVLDHVVDLHTNLLSMAGVDVPEVGDDPHAAWSTATTAAATALADPSVAERQFDSGFAGLTSLSAIFGTFGAVDLVVHRWDLATAAGVDATLADDDLALVWDFVHDKGDMLRTPGGFGPEIEVGPDATEQERVLGFLGRSA